MDYGGTFLHTSARLTGTLEGLARPLVLWWAPKMLTRSGVQQGLPSFGLLSSLWSVLITSDKNLMISKSE